jgi:hypothetical protein
MQQNKHTFPIERFRRNTNREDFFSLSMHYYSKIIMYKNGGGLEEALTDARLSLSLSLLRPM